MNADKELTSLLYICLQIILPATPSILNPTCDGCLFLSPLIKNGNARKARILSEVDCNLFQGVESYSGFITVNKPLDSNLFFWYFPASENKTNNAPWIIWLQGGPGYSSLTGVFVINGPFVIKKEKLYLRNFTWTRDYSVLYIDNPVGAGFSFTGDDSGYTSNEDQVSEQLNKFLQQFLAMFPELRKRPLFIAGQSYAGKYVPALSWQIHRRQNKNAPINLKGLSMGNALIDPRSSMSYSTLCEGIGLLSDSRLEILRQMEKNVLKLIDLGRMVDASNAFNKTIEYIKKYSQVNIMNFNLEPTDSAITFLNYLKRKDVREAIHVGDASFDLNNQLVYEKMLPDIMNTTKPMLEELLEYYGVLLYSGQLDVIVPYVGTRGMLTQLRWSGKELYKNAPRMRLRHSGKGYVVGYMKSGGNLTEILIRRAGHMVPVEQPEVAFHMISSFIQEYK